MTRGWVVGLWLALSLVLSCASGPHPALEVAAHDLGCPIAQLQRHEIFPNRQRVEGCGKEGIFVKDCSGYGLTAQCRWVRATGKL